MIGYKIYLVYCEYTNGERVVQTLHATFDGTYQRLQTIREYWIEKGFLVKEGLDGAQHVMYKDGAFFRDYYVITRTIQK